ncbi:MAG TPA: oligosaccharide flippase family protein [Steroidobacteraceae bacterium]|nr:oligosaccharide flippase family protein [Steroidobacteraceae bacterium]
MSQGSTAAAVPAVPHRLERRAISLGVANAIDYAIQFLLPVVLVRCLAPEDFGKYRLLWLVAGTVMAVVTQAMSGSLYYFLPRSADQQKRLYINQAMLYLSACGMLAALAVSPWNPWLPQSVRELAPNPALLPAFVLFWVAASLLDMIGSAEERVVWQTRTIIGLSALRAVALSAAALLTREFEPVLVALLGFVICKFTILLTYVGRYHGLGGPFLRRRAFAEQLRQSVPFGFAGALYGLRAQADQWVATALFSVGMFASFSIATILGPLVNLCRQSVLQAFLPSISRLEAAGDFRGMLELNGRGSVLVATLVFPLLAFAFAFSVEIVTTIYTSTYVAAAPVMRIYILGLIALVIEPATLMVLLRQGPFTMRLGAFALVLSVALSWACARGGGLAGAAVGSVTAIYLEHAGALWRISHSTGIPWRHLQDWRSLGLLLLCATLAGLISWAAVREVLAGFGPEVRAAAGGVLLGAVYVALCAMCGLARDWRATVEGLWSKS